VGKVGSKGKKRGGKATKKEGKRRREFRKRIVGEREALKKRDIY